ncbi:hypothetical protein K458DRAFT_487060 [Lentithecium fluviatile CBS 122367]|uniref:Uncharacterized protein n=1 Tax=Lentithecium fluviatile CBS 122367 TaxID=1168545 RepID=A0A6G1J2J9_9PLEO|nr:hypothetical protein K458DRAFT_487060 [Lentithecium fluviatile CBS 122367]
MNQQRNIIRSLGCLTKKWGPAFFEDRNPPETPFLEGIRSDVETYSGNELREFLEVNREIPLRHIEDVMRFCQRAVLPSNDTYAQRNAWLDDREWNPNSAVAGATPKECFRQYSSPLTAAKLCEHLKQKRFNHGRMPDAHRRLIYIADIDSDYVMALVNTVDWLQVPTLRDAIWKHITLQTSLRLKIPAIGRDMFQMELHMPQYALRTHFPSQPDTMNSKCRKWRDLAFLIHDFPGSQQEGCLCLYEAHFAVALCGTDERRWTAYCFEDSAFDSDRELNESDFCYSTINADPIASDGVTDGNRPLWDPREYFLAILRIRIDQIRNEWICTVRTIESIVHEYTDGDLSFPKASGPNMRDNEAMIQMFEWTHKALRLVQKLLEALKKTNAVWKKFTSPNGDVCYFSDFEQASPRGREHVRRCFSNINEAFEGLEGIQQRVEDLKKRLKSLEHQCQTSAQVLQLRLSFETSKASQSNGSVAEIMISAVSPIGIVSTFFAMPQRILYFKRNTVSFIVSVIVVTAVLQLLLIFRGIGSRQGVWRKWIVTSRHFLQGYVSGITVFLSGWYYANILRSSIGPSPRPGDSAELGDMSLTEL